MSGLPTPPFDDVAAWSWQVLDVGSGTVVAERDPDRLLRTASVGKVFLLLEVAARLADGRLRPDDLVSRASTPPVADSGLWQHLVVDALPVADAARLVGAVSDNLATNVLLERVGLEAVQARARQVAPGGSQLHDLVRNGRGPGHPPTLSTGCARDLASLVARLERSEVLGEPVDGRVRDWLSCSVDLSMVAAPLAVDPLVHADEAGPVAVWNKTGTDRGVRADVGVVRDGRRSVAYAVLCNWPQDVLGGASARDVLAFMSEVGSTLL